MFVLNPDTLEILQLEYPIVRSVWNPLYPKGIEGGRGLLLEPVMVHWQKVVAVQQHPLQGSQVQMWAQDVDC